MHQQTSFKELLKGGFFYFSWMLSWIKPVLCLQAQNSYAIDAMPKKMNFLSKYQKLRVFYGATGHKWSYFGFFFLVCCNYKKIITVVFMRSLFKYEDLMLFKICVNKQKDKRDRYKIHNKIYKLIFFEIIFKKIDEQWSNTVSTQKYTSVLGWIN